MKSDGDEKLEAALEALLGDGPAGEESERARLAAELARAGEALRARAFRAPRHEARFVNAVLARTTREDLSWRGDLRLWGDFLRARLRASPALRLVAASLALHLVAGPALAWWMLHERPEERAFTLHIELPSELPFVDEVPEPEEPDDELARAARAREARENERASLRHGLQATLPAVSLTATDVPELARLGAHLEALRTRTAPAAPVAREGEGLLARSLELELALDRVWLGAEPEGPARGLAVALARELERRPPGEAPHLAQATLRRAWCEGLLDEEPARAPRPFSDGWFEALERAAREEPGPATEALLAWCRAARPK